jgi:hypothetical protein
LDDFRLKLAQELLDQVESDRQYNKILRLVTEPKDIIKVGKNEYFVKSSENRFKAYHVFLSHKKGYLCTCKFYTIDLKQTKACSHIVACRIYQILHHGKK